MEDVMIESLKEAARRLAAPMLNRGFKPDGLYEYTTPDGKVTHARVRAKHPGTGEKWIRPVTLNGEKWELREPSFPAGKPLYRLHDLVASPNKSVWWMEGEPKADALTRLGLLATTAGASNSDKSADFRPLANRYVTIWPDNDAPGREHAARVAEKLRALGCRVDVLDVDALILPPKGDCIEWLTANPDATAADVEKLPRLGSIADWPKPLPLVSHDEAAPYPLDSLPGVIGAAVREVVGFVQCPVPLAACSALTAISTVVQGLVNVRRAENLTGPVSLYVLAVAESGERKTTCDNYFTSAISEWEVQKIEEKRPEVAKYASDLAAWEARRDGILNAIRKAVAATTPKPTKDLENELHGHELKKPVPPKVPRMIFKDVTSQKLGERLATGWPSGAIISAEAGIVLGGHSMKGDSQMGTLALLNCLWSGESFISDRRTTESYALRGARLTMGLATHPDTVRAFFDATEGLARGSGFAARFLIAWPRSTQGERPFRDAPESWPLLSAFNRRIGALLDTPLPLDEHKVLTPTALDLSPEARTKWIAFHDEVEQELRPGGDMAETKDVASKCADNAARLAALFHVFEHGPSGQIGLDAMKSACSVATWHLYEARRFLGELALPPPLVNAVKLDAWLLRWCRDQKVDSVLRSVVQRRGPSPLRDGLVLDKAITALTGAYRILLKPDGREKRLAINPALLGDTNGTP
jgi:putative DNA primase/helicase